MESNNEKKQEVDVNLGVATQKASFITTEPNPSDGRYASGKTLRREYIYQQRDEYIREFGEVPTEEQMELFAVDARKLYISEGDYKVVGNEATYLGQF